MKWKTQTFNNCFFDFFCYFSANYEFHMLILFFLLRHSRCCTLWLPLFLIENVNTKQKRACISIIFGIVCRLVRRAMNAVVIIYCYYKHNHDDLIIIPSLPRLSSFFLSFLHSLCWFKTANTFKNIFDQKKKKIHTQLYNPRPRRGSETQLSRADYDSVRAISLSIFLFHSLIH